MHHKFIPESLAHFKPDETLYVITTISNPVLYKSRYELYRQFEARMLANPKIKLYTVELAFANRAFEITKFENPRHIQVRGSDEVWHKENLLNIALAALPHDWQYVAWIDADVSFVNPRWAEATIQQLQHHKIIQLFQDAIDLGPNGEVIETHKAFCYQHTVGATRGPVYEFWHPGFAWAARRDTIEKLGGFIDFAVLGAGDHHMALAFVHDAIHSVPGNIHPNYIRKVLAFEERCKIHLQMDIGYIPGTILHYWHGKKKDRKYVERWDILTKNKFDPDVDIIKNSRGVLSLMGNKPKLRDDIRAYFRQRNEDSIDL